MCPLCSTVSLLQGHAAWPLLVRGRAGAHLAVSHWRGWGLTMRRRVMGGKWPHSSEPGGRGSEGTQGKGMTILACAGHCLARRHQGYSHAITGTKHPHPTTPDQSHPKVLVSTHCHKVAAPLWIRHGQRKHRANG